MPVPDAWKRKAYGDESNRPRWLEYRARLLEQTLGASMRAQTVKPAKVYLLASAGDSDFCQNNLDPDLFTPIYLDRPWGTIGAELKRAGLSGCVALSRIDSDDIVSKTYLEQIGHALTPAHTEPTWIVAVNGYRCDLKLIQRVYYNCSPFLTLYVPNFTGQDVYAFSHEDVTKHPHIRSQAEWMQVVHESNVGNAFGTNPLLPEQFERERSANAKLVTETARAFDPAWFLEWAGYPLRNEPIIPSC